MLFLCSRVGSHSRETVLHKLLQCECFPQAAALHELPQHGSIPQGAVLQEQAATAWFPHGVTSPASKPAPAWAPLSVGPQVLAGASFRHPPALAWGPFHRLQVEICSTVDQNGTNPELMFHSTDGRILC